MPNWLGKCLCVVATVGVFDGHLMLAQSWAWISMLQDRTPAQGISAALDSTFSGNAPCSMCCAIQEAQQDRDEEAPIPESRPGVKFPPVMWSTQFVLIPPVASHALIRSDVDEMPEEQLARPPSPPPRFG